MIPRDNSGKPLSEAVRAIYLKRQDGALEIEANGGARSLFFRRGELYLDRDDPAAPGLGAILASADGGPADSEVGRILETVARQFAASGAKGTYLRSDRSSAVEVIGPLPTVRFLQELAVSGANERELKARLGGAPVKLRSSSKTPALAQLSGLEPDMARVLTTLEQPVTLEVLLRGAGADRLGFLRALTKLWAVGLVVRMDDDESRETLDRRRQILSPNLLQKFSTRIGDSLARDSLGLDFETHRHRLADLLAHLGEKDLYELLGIGPQADDSEIFAAYYDLARLVHPSHASALGLDGKEEAVLVLFERATEAYLTLSDPHRRASYNTVAGVHVEVAVDAAQRDAEKREIARQNYRRASSCLADMEYSLAVDLLKEATRMDPRPEYFARLGQVQSKNPHWYRHAVENFERALRLDPENAGIRSGYGQVLEEMERFADARVQYQAALERMPDHADARDGLERLSGGVSSVAAKTSGGFRRLFARSGKG